MSVDKRMRADMHAIGRAVNPDTWSALEEVETMAGRQSMRRNALLAVAAAVLLLVGIGVVPAVGDWWQSGPEVASADEGDAAVAPDPAVEALLDDITAATNAADVQAVLALLTEDATYFGTPVAQTAPGGLAVQVERYAGYGLERVDIPALVVTDGFDYAIAYRGTSGGADRLYLVRARALDDGLRIYEISALNGAVLAPVGQEGEQGAAVDPTVEALLDNLTAATNAADVQAVLALLTDDATYFGTPVAEAAEGPGLAIQITRYSGYGLERNDVPALVVTDGFDYAIAYRGTAGGVDFLYLVRARSLAEGLSIYEITVLKGP